MTRRLLLTLTLAATAACAPVAAADAAKPAPYPSVSKVEPLNLGIGDTLKLTGKNFSAGKNKNTVVFKRDGKKAIFVKAHAATKTTLTLTVPEKLRAALGKKAGAEVPTKFRLRVLSRRFAKGYTALKSSPTIAPLGRKLIAEEVKKTELAAAAAAAATAATPPPPAPPAPADCDNDGTPDSADTSSDKDGLTDSVEKNIKTDPCNVDTDGDGMEDGWEYKSAYDLNRHSCPEMPYPVPCSAIAPKYPIKRPYTNPLYGGDSGTDFDGDLLAAGAEHEAWKRKVGNVRDLSIPLWYSDGLQASIDDGHSTTCRGMRVPPPLGEAQYDVPAYRVYSLDSGDPDVGCLNDAERDEDGDWLSNTLEHDGPGLWVDLFKEVPFRIEYAGTDWLDPDSDGDGIIDAKDDQDHDDFWNIEELYRGFRNVDKEGNGEGSPSSGLWVDEFNPCLPSIYSRTCPLSIPTSGAVWTPFVRPEDDAPKPRWPLYGNPGYYPGEYWTGMPVSEQRLPPQHPLPRCDFGRPPNC